jgi:hypothetical protein
MFTNRPEDWRLRRAMVSAAAQTAVRGSRHGRARGANAGPDVPTRQHFNPGMTETSLVPELAPLRAEAFGELVQWMIEDASLNR